MRHFYALILLVIFGACTSQEKTWTAQEIIDKSMDASGTHLISNSTISFDFRGRTYIADRASGLFSLQRHTKKGDSSIVDILSNKGYQRTINDISTTVPDSMAIKYSESVNSVHYFSVLPYGLNDRAVKKKLLAESTIKGKEYHKVEITFEQEGGGVDYEDVFIYWIDKQNFMIDYLAYEFHVNGGGVRFREVIKDTLVSGIRLVNYANYKSENNTSVYHLDQEFDKDQLKRLSEINLTNVNVSLKN